MSVFALVSNLVGVMTGGVAIVSTVSNVKLCPADGANYNTRTTGLPVKHTKELFSFFKNLKVFIYFGFLVSLLGKKDMTFGHFVIIYLFES